MKNNYKTSDYEDKQILFELLVHEVGYKRASELYDKAKEFYNPIEYAVIKTKESLETRDAVHNKKKSMS